MPFIKGHTPWNKGKHPEYMQGKNHPFYGKHHTIEAREKFSKAKKGKSVNLENKNGMWKGNQVGYFALHSWIRKRIKKPIKCPNCKKIKSLEITNIDGKYTRNLKQWKWLCRRCHMKIDGRLEKLITFRKKYLQKQLGLLERMP